MSFAEFTQALTKDTPPAGLSAALQGLWHDGKGHWEQAHRAVQDDGSRDGCWVHAYLHRKEGDDGNAGYWYARAKRTMPTAAIDFKAEWTGIVRELLGEK